MTISTTETTTNSGTGTETGTGTDGGGGRFSGATRRAGDALGTVRTRASDAYSAARERTSSAYGTARQSASRARERTAQGVDTFPEGAILGGLALGALIAAVLPKSQRESEMFGSLGKRINDTARQAAQAATEAGRSHLEEAGLSRDAARQKLSDIAATAGQAARTSASAAAQAVKGGQQQQ